MACRGSAVRIRLAPLGFPSLWLGFLVFRGTPSAHGVLPGYSHVYPFLRMILRIGNFLRTWLSSSGLEQKAGERLREALISLEDGSKPPVKYC